MHSFHCPYCSVPLRVRDLSYRGRTIPCPECRQPVVIREAADGLVGVRDPNHVSPPPVPLKRERSQWSPGLWISLACGVLLVVGAGWWISTAKTPSNAVQEIPKEKPREQPVVAAPAAEDSPIEVVLADSESEPILPLVAEDASENPAVPPSIPDMPPSVVTADDAPIDVLLAEDGPGFDIQERLAQPIIGFRPTRALPLEDMLFEVQELLGAPIDLSGISPETRQKSVMLELGETTVGKILDQVTQAGEVAYEVDPRKIVIRPGTNP